MLQFPLEVPKFVFARPGVVSAPASTKRSALGSAVVNLTSHRNIQCNIVNAP